MVCGSTGGATPKGGHRMSLIQMVVTLIIVGFLMWLVNRFIPMQSTIKAILNGLVAILVVIWLVNVFGLMHYITRFHVTR
jgi:thiol:disulfide interchange protein